MGIRFQCPGCRRNLNVKSFLAGKRGICPKCTERFTIPESSTVAPAVNRPRWTGTGAESDDLEEKVKSSAAGSSAAVKASNSTASTNQPDSAGSEAVPRDAKHFENFEATLSEFVAQHEDSEDDVEVEGNESGPFAASGGGAAKARENGATVAASQAQGASSRAEQRPTPPAKPPATEGMRFGKTPAGIPPRSRKPSPDWEDPGVSGPSGSGPSVPGQSQGAGGDAGESFESLDAHSFVLDRPQQEAALHPTGYYDWIAEAPQAIWYVRHSNGAQYGPAIGRQMRAWVDEGRVAEGCHVWREGWANWRQAIDVFPQIRPRVGATADQTPVMAPTAPEPESPGQRHGNRWLFPAVLMFLAVVAVVIGVMIYLVVNQRTRVEDLPPAPENPGEIVDPFASSSLLPWSVQLP